MDVDRGPALPFAACLAGLLLTLVAFADLPLLGSAAGALLSGAVAALVAKEALDGTRGALLAGAVAVAVLALLALAGGEVFRGSPLLVLPGAVLVAQAALLGLLPGAAAAVAGRLLPRPAEGPSPTLEAGQDPPPGPPGSRDPPPGAQP